MEEKKIYKEKKPEIIRLAPKISDKLKAISMHFQSQCRVAREKQPPMLEPLGVFFSEFPLQEIPYGDESEPTIDNAERKENKNELPLKKIKHKEGSDAELQKVEESNA